MRPRLLLRNTRRWTAAGAALLTTLTAHPLCALVFDCGCRWFFAGAEAHCNIQVPGPPDCPVCTDLAVGGAFALAVLLAWWALLRAACALAARLRRRLPLIWGGGDGRTRTG